MTQPAPLLSGAISSLATARGGAFAGLCKVLGLHAHSEAAFQCGMGWALADIAAGLRDPDEKSRANDLLEGHNWYGGGLPRLLRPLAVLHGLARRSAQQGGGLGDGGARALLLAMRLGLLGR